MTLPTMSALAMALCRALDRDLPGITRTRKDGTEFEVRPVESQVQVFHFPQTWSTTALGFTKEWGGQGFTTAYTTVVLLGFETACVYFDGEHAYTVKTIGSNFLFDLSHHDMSCQERSVKYDQSEDGEQKCPPPSNND